jgi:hypothetical protein
MTLRKKGLQDAMNYDRSVLAGKILGELQGVV